MRVRSVNFSLIFRIFFLSFDCFCLLMHVQIRGIRLFAEPVDQHGGSDQAGNRRQKLADPDAGMEGFLLSR